METVSGNNIAPAAIIEPLRIDSTNLYEGMEQTYGQGYIPRVVDGKAIIILPLVGQTYDDKVTVTADLGTMKDSPFVFGNYSQTVDISDGAYVFRFEILLEAKRINGAYPVTMKADYLNAEGNQAQQSFTVYVTITDGSDPSVQNTRETIEKPKLFISSCETDSQLISGEDVFTVTVTIENIGAIRARSVLLTYGSDTVGIVPDEINNVIHLNNIASGSSQTVSFGFQTTKDVPAGNQTFYVRLDYEDLYAGVYTETRTFLIQVTQPAEMEYDSIAVPGQVISGETFLIPVNVFNTGKSTLRNVTATISAPGLFPLSSVFFGDILPGQPGNGEMEVYTGRLSMANGYTQDYGKTSGIFTITYTDDNGEIHREEMEFSTEILRPVIEAEESNKEQETVGQWWISVLVAFAIIAILVAVIVTTNFTRMMRMRVHTY
ncbi:MAG: hypothetical protein J1E64_10960 [Acetatifactor sp.]|nr:hypothetical protein [Acetatifactor sp.]